VIVDAALRAWSAASMRIEVDMMERR